MKKCNIKYYEYIKDVFDLIDKSSFIITDDNVYKYYKDDIDHFRHYIFKHGEKNKNLSTVKDIYDFLLNNGCNRNSKVYGLGGGIVTDITGYVASTYMRGIAEFNFIPTTLLAMVDASIGGKNGVNFNNYKNIVGTINLPNNIYICPEFLDTLPERDLKAGYGEVFKYGIGFNRKILSMFTGFDMHGKKLLKLIKTCIQEKENIIKNDIYESGDRKLLNLGHTIAHAIEKGTHKYLHGEAVYVGLFHILSYAFSNSYISGKDYNYLMSFLGKHQICKLPCISNWMQYIDKDKKQIKNNLISIIIPISCGKCKIVEIETKNFQSFFEFL